MNQIDNNGNNLSGYTIIDINDKQESISHTSSSKLKTYWFIMAIIVGIVGIGLGGAGVAGHFHVGALSNLAQINAITMMAVGGGGGISFLILGIVGTVKNRKKEIVPDKSIHEPNFDKIKDPKKEAFIERTRKGTIRKQKRFGKTDWERYFGKIGEEPPLPENIEEILDNPCPFSGNHKVKVRDTHMLVLIPATVNGKDLTLDRLGELIQNPLQGNKTKYFCYENSWTKREHGSAQVGRSHWVLMTRDVLPHSRNKTYNDQKKLVKQYADHGYFVPDAIDAAVCISMEFVASGEYLYGRHPETYTRCVQTVRGEYPVVVGGFDSVALDVDENFFDAKKYGVAALRKF